MVSRKGAKIPPVSISRADPMQRVAWQGTINAFDNIATQPAILILFALEISTKLKIC
jgi:hypothetical protein